MDMNIIFSVAPFIMLLVAIIKRGEVAGWLAFVMVVWMLVAQYSPTQQEMVFFAVAANSLLVYVMSIHYKATKNLLPVLISITLCFEVMFNFLNLLIISNGYELLSLIGWATGGITYLQILLTIILKDDQGALRAIVHDTKHLFSRPSDLRRN